MNIPKRLIKVVKPLAVRTIYREGSIRTIFAGPCRGLKYRIFPEFGWSYLYGGWEPEAQAVIRHAVKQGTTAYDIGANYGMHALLMARLTGTVGRVYAFEPVPVIFESLKENMMLNKLDPVECVRLGVSDSSGTVKFFTGDHLGAGHMAGVGNTSGSKIEIDTVSLDDFVFDENRPPPDFIKIDVEGAESRVICGARRTLETYRPILLIDLHTPEQDVAVGTALAQFGYRARRTSEDRIITNMSSGWPDANGVWGQIVAWHHSSPYLI